MRVRWRDFELPTRVICEEKTMTPTYGLFIAEPFERGFGVTVGNSLRRVLLSSIEGTSVTWLKIQGVSHEFSTISGVYEDVTDICLNFKKLVLRLHTEEPKRLKIDVKEKGEVKALHIQPDAAVEIINPDLHIATLIDDLEFQVEFEVRRGRGYVPSAELVQQQEEQEIGVIPLDAAYSPVRRVKCRVETTRVGRLSNYDRLVMEVWTNGTVSPEMAMVEASKIFRKHLNPFVQYLELGRELQVNERRQEESRKREEYLDELRQKLDLNISELDLSVRAANCLTVDNVHTLGDLVRRTEPDVLKIRNFGRTSLKEVKKKLLELGLSLGMDLEALTGKKVTSDAASIGR